MSSSPGGLVDGHLRSMVLTVVVLVLWKRSRQELPISQSVTGVTMFRVEGLRSLGGRVAGQRGKRVWR